MVRPSTSRGALQEFENQIKSSLKCRDFSKAEPRERTVIRERKEKVWYLLILKERKKMNTTNKNEDAKDLKNTENW